MTNFPYKTMKKITCKYCGESFYNNGFSTHEYYCKRKHEAIFTNCKRVIVYWMLSVKNVVVKITIQKIDHLVVGGVVI